jgi:hypothetical protein
MGYREGFRTTNSDFAFVTVSGLYSLLYPGQLDFGFVSGHDFSRAATIAR